MAYTKVTNLWIVLLFLLACTPALANNTPHSNGNNERFMNVNNDSLLMIESQTLSKAYQFDAAIELLEQVVKTDSLNMEALTRLEGLYFKTSQHNAAILLADYLIAHKVDSAYYQIRKGLALKSLGQYQHSIDIFLSTFAADTSNSYISAQIGDLYKALEKPDSALVFYNKTCQIKPNSSAMIKAMDLYLKQKQEEEALYFFASYFKPEFESNHILLRLFGKALYLNGKLKLAHETFSCLYAAGDSSLVTCKFLGTCLWKQEYYNEGIPVLESFILRDSLDYQVFFMLGSCHMKSDTLYNSEKGIYCMEKAISLIEPDGKTLNLMYNELALHYRHIKKYDKELEMYLTMKEYEPESKYVDYQMATLFDYGFNNKTEALKRYQNLLALYKTDTINTKKSDIVTFCESRVQELKEEQFWKKK